MKESETSQSVLIGEKPSIPSPLAPGIVDSKKANAVTSTQSKQPKPEEQPERKVYKSTKDAKELIQSLKSNVHPMKESGFHRRSYLNFSGTLVINTTEDEKTINVSSLIDKKLVQEIQLKDPESDDPS